MIDIHTHILPEIDDGSRSVDESVSMLETLFRQGVDTVAATPHFYVDRIGFDEFIEMREKSAKKLAAAVEAIPDRPGIALGAEVQFFSEMYSFEKLNMLCIGGTRYILVEMPFERWTEYTYQALERIYFNRGIIPIIAHVERYMRFNKTKEMLPRIVEANAQIQINSGFLQSGKTRRKAVGMLKDGRVSFVASDCHNMTSRPPNLSEGMQIVKKKLGTAGTEHLRRRELALKEKLQVF